MSTPLDQSYRLCCRIARRTAKNFYYSFLTMPAEKRRAMCAIYAFMRRSDDIADEAGSLPQLREWRAQLQVALDGKETDDCVLPALVDTVRRYRIPQQHFFDLLDGAEMDQTTKRYETFDDLYRYCYRVASCVGLVVLPVFGYEDRAALEPAEACGIAFQITNILRDVKEDAALGRIYLPLEDLRRFGVTEDDVMNNRFTPEFVKLMEFEAMRAREYYRKAEALPPLISPDSRATLRVMMAIYRGILDEIERRGYAVLEGRVRLSAWTKWRIVMRHWGKS